MTPAVLPQLMVTSRLLALTAHPDPTTAMHRVSDPPCTLRTRTSQYHLGLLICAWVSRSTATTQLQAQVMPDIQATEHLLRQASLAMLNSTMPCLSIQTPLSTPSVKVSSTMPSRLLALLRTLLPSSTVGLPALNLQGRQQIIDNHTSSTQQYLLPQLACSVLSPYLLKPTARHPQTATVPMFTWRALIWTSVNL